MQFDVDNKGVWANTRAQGEKIFARSSGGKVTVETAGSADRTCRKRDYMCSTHLQVSARGASAHSGREPWMRGLPVSRADAIWVAMVAQQLLKRTQVLRGRSFCAVICPRRSRQPALLRSGARRGAAGAASAGMSSPEQPVFYRRGVIAGP